MRVLVTGATGFIGSYLSHQLLKAGHSLRILTRNVQVTQALFVSDPHFSKVSVYPWNGFELLPSEIFSEVDAVIHLAGENIGQWPWSKKSKQRILDSRVLGTRALVASMSRLKKPPQILVAASAVGFYGDAGAEVKLEMDPVGHGFLAEVALAWETEIFKAETLGIRTVAVRNGIVLGRTQDGKMGGALGKMLLSFQMGLGSVVGTGDQFWSWVHLEDTVGIFLHALKHQGLHGPVNACAPTPVSQKEFGHVLAQALHRPFIFKVPSVLIKTVLGEMSSTLLQSQRASSKKLVDSGYQFQFPILKTALQNLVLKRK